MSTSGNGWPSCTTRWKSRPSRFPAGSEWSRSIRIGPRRISRSGWALQDESRFDEAREHYDAAIQLQPDFAAAYLNLGGLQEELGDMAAAEAVVPHRARETARLRAAARPAGDLACAPSCPKPTWPRLKSV